MRLQALDHLDAEFADFLAQGVAVEPEQLRRLDLVAVRRRQAQSRSAAAPRRCTHAVVEARRRQARRHNRRNARRDSARPIAPSVSSDSGSSGVRCARVRRARPRRRRSVITSSAVSTTSRRTRFSSSRTLPGHGWRFSARWPPASNRFGGKPSRSALRRKWRTRSGMSSSRSRNGGSRIGTTLSR